MSGVKRPDPKLLELVLEWASGFYKSEFTGRKRVKTSDLIAPNKGGYLKPDKHKGNGTVYVIERKGRYYIVDGHHTAAHAGDTVTVRVKKVP